MKVYVGFDDTDHAEGDRGTGKVARPLINKTKSYYKVGEVVKGSIRKRRCLSSNSPLLAARDEFECP